MEGRERRKARHPRDGKDGRDGREGMKGRKGDIMGREGSGSAMAMLKRKPRLHIMRKIDGT